MIILEASDERYKALMIEYAKEINVNELTVLMQCIGSYLAFEI